jgi:hypothetical protein
MIRTLLIIAGASLVLAIAALGGAAALGGQDLARNGWSWTLTDDGHDSVRFERSNRVTDNAPDVTRQLTWDGTDTLTVSSLGEVTYVQGATPSVVVTGPALIADRVRVEGGAVTMTDMGERVVVGMDSNGISARADSERLRIVVTAPNVTRFNVRGSQRLKIQNYDQPNLAIDLAGSGEVEASGTAQALTLTIAGSGEADLEGLRLTDATVDISGSGNARLGPSGRARVSISGSGDVEMTTRPQQLETSISGSGEVQQDG